ncbi:hypothetical protein ACFQPG_04315 [Sphingomonas sp. GCM10030256]|uniref:hypothetical protein n=1 Tax=Sphingomonas sp. GCM10030256 TaxID=3273427 RepID=UPI00360DC109
MIRTPLLLTLAAAAALAGCDQGSHTIVQNGPPDPMANELAAAPPVELPKPIVASHSYRCKDNSLVYIDWLAENSGANVRTEKTSASTPLKPGADGKPPFTAEGGYSVSGSVEDASVTIALAGKEGQSCKRG